MADRCGPSSIVHRLRNISYLFEYALHKTGYQGCWSIEHHSGKDKYAEVAVQLAKVRAVLAHW
jgi:hypothetical protein